MEEATGIPPLKPKTGLQNSNPWPKVPFPLLGPCGDCSYLDQISVPLSPQLSRLLIPLVHQQLLRDCHDRPPLLLGKLISQWQNMHSIPGNRTCQFAVWPGAFTIARLFSCNAWPADVTMCKKLPGAGQKLCQSFFRLVKGFPCRKAVLHHLDGIKAAKDHAANEARKLRQCKVDL